MKILDKKWALMILGMVAACSTTPAGPSQEQTDDVAATDTRQAAEVHHVGDRRTILEQGDLEGKIELGSLSDHSNLFAVGPVAGLRGEITIYNGQPSISTVVDGRPHIDESLAYEGIFLAYADVPEWKAIPLKQPVEGSAEIEALILEQARAAGVDVDRPFPFRLEGTAEQLDYHIIFKSDDAPHNHTEHQKAKKKFDIEQRQVQIVGFAVPEGEVGVYTPASGRIHMHFQLPDNSESGHVDHVRLEQDTTLFLPVR
ncbi:MAG: acetolactate decarboxylase [Persicimonas sp.]